MLLMAISWVLTATAASASPSLEAIGEEDGYYVFRLRNRSEARVAIEVAAAQSTSGALIETGSCSGRGPAFLAGGRRVELVPARTRRIGGTVENSYITGTYAWVEPRQEVTLLLRKEKGAEPIRELVFYYEWDVVCEKATLVPSDRVHSIVKVLPAVPGKG